MKSHQIAAILLLPLVAATPSLAQYPLGAVAFYISTSLGNTAGGPCWWFNCTPATISVTAGEVVTLKIAGEQQAPYVLASSTTATSCIAFPGILHNLVIDLPAVITLTGTLSSTSPVLSCPNGYTNIVASVPLGIPLGTTIAIQALTYGAGNVLAFTGAIVLTII
jgi:hypothetical protein